MSKNGRIKMRKNSELRIKCTTEELEKIKRDAEKTGMTYSEYSLRILLNAELEIRIKSR